MKTITIFLFALFLSKGCSRQSEQDLKNTVVEYSVRTRGFSQLVVIQKQEIKVNTNRRGVESMISENISNADWAILIIEFQKIKMADIESFKAPSNKRSTDAAAIGQLTIKHLESTYSSQSFDDGNPPKALKKLLEKIAEITNTIENQNDNN